MNDWIWVTRDKQSYKLTEMARTHVQNSLQWCIRNKPQPLAMQGSDIEFDITKDGHTYDEWILAFTVRLLDPACI